MCRFGIILFLLMLNSKQSFSVTIQRGAKLLYMNPQYVANATVMTTRQNRRSPYLTSAHATVLWPAGNNVTVRFAYNEINSKSEYVNLELKMCDFMKLKWAAEWCRLLGIEKCPFPAGTYGRDGIEFPPKNFPLKLPNGDYRLTLTYLVTASRVKVLEFEMDCKIQNKV